MNGRDGHVKCINARFWGKSAACDKSLCQGGCICGRVQYGNVVECDQASIRRFGIALRGFVEDELRDVEIKRIAGRPPFLGDRLLAGANVRRKSSDQEIYLDVFLGLSSTTG